MILKKKNVFLSAEIKRRSKNKVWAQVLNINGYEFEYYEIICDSFRQVTDMRDNCNWKVLQLNFDGEYESWLSLYDTTYEIESCIRLNYKDTNWYKFYNGKLSVIRWEISSNLLDKNSYVEHEIKVWRSIKSTRR